jgi:hypothetical protein
LLIRKGKTKSIQICQHILTFCNHQYIHINPSSYNWPLVLHWGGMNNFILMFYYW